MNLVNALGCLLCFGAMTLLLVLAGKTLAEEIKPYDKEWRVQERIQGGKIYDREWNLKGQIENGRIFDKNWKTKWHIGKGKQGNSGFSVASILRGFFWATHESNRPEEPKSNL